MNRTGVVIRFEDTDADGHKVVESLPPGRYYARWIASDEHGRVRLACNCGHRGPWQDSTEVARDHAHSAH